MTRQSAHYSASDDPKRQVAFRILANFLTFFLLFNLFPVAPSPQALPLGPIRQSNQEELRGATERERSLQEARKLNNESLKLQSSRKYDEALQLAERALFIREKALGPEHPDIAASLNNLSLLYEYRREYAKAELLFQRALTIR
jgi:tetratricopeptide (TPR) repeat protein